MDYGFKREKQPWEASDGAVYLLAGLSEIQPAEVPSLMPDLAEVAMLDHWPQARSLQTTIWSQLPRLMRGLGKQVCHIISGMTGQLKTLTDPVSRTLCCGKLGYVHPASLPSQIGCRCSWGSRQPACLKMSHPFVDDTAALVVQSGREGCCLTGCPRCTPCAGVQALP